VDDRRAHVDAGVVHVSAAARGVATSGRPPTAAQSVSGNDATASDARFGVGGDVTGYLVPDNLREAYGAPVSFHVFLRYRPAGADHAAVTHVH